MSVLVTCIVWSFTVGGEALARKFKKEKITREETFSALRKLQAETSRSSHSFDILENDINNNTFEQRFTLLASHDYANGR